VKHLIRNRATGLEIPVVVSPPIEEEWIWAAVEGDPFGNRPWETEAWELVPVKPTAAEFLDTLKPGDRFTVNRENGDRVWANSDFVVFIGKAEVGSDGAYLQGIRYGQDDATTSLYLFDTDTFNLVI
jgi:hypothetical protein